MTAKNKPNELSITRLYNAKVEQVWDAWVDPNQVAQWWGPRGFTLTTKRKDVRNGGCQTRPTIASCFAKSWCDS